jgi:hypothetical protein
MEQSMQWRITAKLNDTDRSKIASVMFSEPFTTYHARRKHHLSSHQLADFRACPKLYYRKKMGLAQSDDSPAFAMGRAAHVWILEGKAAFDEQYAVGGPINEKTGKPYGADTKAFAEWAETIKKPVLTTAQAGLIRMLAESVAGHERARQLIDDGACEQVVRAKLFGFACQARIDLWSRVAGIVDLKTCEDLSWFGADIKKHQYVHQMAFYRAVLAVAADVDQAGISVDLIAVEKREPYRVGVWRLASGVLDNAASENEAAMNAISECEHAGMWPTGFEGVNTIESEDIR